MKLIAILSTVLFTALSAQAHLEPGVYSGKTAQGQACFMQIVKVYFEKNQQHPLNERALIQVGSNKEIQITVGHPPLIDVATATAAFNHDFFHGVLPTATGAMALVVKMAHTQTFEGPTEFHFIQHEYKSNKRSVQSCVLSTSRSIFRR